MSGPTREELDRLGEVPPAVARSIDLRRRTEEGLTPEEAGEQAEGVATPGGEAVST